MERYVQKDWTMENYMQWESYYDFDGSNHVYYGVTITEDYNECLRIGETFGKVVLNNDGRMEFFVEASHAIPVYAEQLVDEMVDGLV